MKTKVFELMAVCIGAAMLAQIAMAQQSEQSQQPGISKETSTQATSSSSGEIRLNKLIGTGVSSKSGESLGKVEDLMIDPATGKITFAILGKGGVLGIGEKRFPAPWKALTVQSEKHFTLNVDKQKMELAPRLKSDYSNLRDLGYVVGVYKFYEIQPMGAMGGAETPGGTESGMEKARTNSSSNPYELDSPARKRRIIKTPEATSGVFWVSGVEIDPQEPRVQLRWVKKFR